MLGYSGVVHLYNNVIESFRHIMLLLIVFQGHFSTLRTVSGRELSLQLGADPHKQLRKRMHTPVFKDLRCFCGETSIFCCLLFDEERDISQYGDGNRKIPKVPKRRPTSSKTPIPARKPWSLIGCNLQVCRDLAGAVPHGSSCVHYINCWKSCGWLQSCPSSLVFNTKSASCDWPSRLEEDDPCYAVNTLRMDWSHARRDRVSHY